MQIKQKDGQQIKTRTVSATEKSKLINEDILSVNPITIMMRETGMENSRNVKVTNNFLLSEKQRHKNYKRNVNQKIIE